MLVLQAILAQASGQHLLLHTLRCKDWSGHQEHLTHAQCAWVCERPSLRCGLQSMSLCQSPCWITYDTL